MASTEQIVNDIKAILNQIQADTSATAQQANQIHGDTTAIKNTTAAILSTEQVGFASVSHGLATVVDRLDETNGWLEINDAQNRLMICWLGIIADLECKQLHRLDRQVELQEVLTASVGRLQAITELVHARETVELEREQDLRTQIEECCPPERPEPEPCFEPCEVDVPEPHRHRIKSYTPLDPPKDQPTRTRG
jgi:hypothetical protein